VNVRALIDLQHIDTALHALANRRARLAERAAHAETVTQMKALQAALAAAQQRSAEASAAIDSLEAQGHDLDKKKARLEGQLKTVIAPREAEALMHEIATIDTQHGELDDAELEAMEAQAAADEEVASHMAALPDTEAAVAAAAAALAEAEAAISAEVDRLTSQRLPAAAAIVPDELAYYDELQRRHEGLGIATLEGTHCSGCHLDLTRGEMDAVKATPADVFPECPQCNRALAR
jgi:uncharacterized protein